MAEFNAREMKCLWKSELCDDTTKELFIAETLYCSGDRAQAMFRLAVQADKRIPAIAKHAGRDSLHRQEEARRRYPGRNRQDEGSGFLR